MSHNCLMRETGKKRLACKSVQGILLFMSDKLSQRLLVFLSKNGNDVNEKICKRPDSCLLCTVVTHTKAEQLRVQTKAESNGESGTAFLELLKRAQKQDSEKELLNEQ